MNDIGGKYNYRHDYPVYRTAGEVMRAAHLNSEFFNSYSEALKFSWKSYKKL